MSASGSSPVPIEEPSYTQEEIHQAIESFSGDDWRRIVVVSKRLASRSGMEAEDLRQEACCRVLESRRCKRSVSVINFIFGVMRSLVWTEIKRMTTNRKLGESRVDFLDDAIVATRSNQNSPESVALGLVIHSRHLMRVLDGIANDPELSKLAEGIMDGLRGDQLAEWLGVSTKGLAAARKRLCRFLVKTYPDGAPI